MAGSQSEQEMGRAVLPSLQSRLAHSLPRYRGPFQALRGSNDYADFWYIVLSMCVLLL